MSTAPMNPRARRRPADGPYFVLHPSFEEPGAEQTYAPPDKQSEEMFTVGHMPDEMTRDYARRMHYAAFRARQASGTAAGQRWLQRYYSCRDLIILGNRKLVYRAVRRWMSSPQCTDDLIGECQLVLINAVAAYNPWLGIRFSTYAFTCLMRALSRLAQRQAADRLAKSLPLEALPDGEPRDLTTEDAPGPRVQRLDEYLSESNPLLTAREKTVIMRRFCLDEHARNETLAEVGRELGLSKERVRQVQASALGKLRKALLEKTPAC